MTPAVTEQAEQLLAQGHCKAEVARELDISYETLRKAIDQGRVRLPESPGELGKLMGLDRVPEVRCLRQKLTRLSAAHDGRTGEVWNGALGAGLPTSPKRDRRSRCS